MMEGPSAHNGMTDMEWLEREQEKEMIELAMERSMNEFQAFQHSQPALQAPIRGPLEPPSHDSMPAMHTHHSYNDHYASGSRRNINISNHIGHEHHHYPPHRGHDNDRDRVGNNRRNTYNIYSGRYGHRENSMRSLSTTGSPMQQRSMAPMGYSRSGSFRQVQEVTETVIDSPHTSYDPRMGGSSMPQAMYHDSRRHSAQPLHQQYDYRGSAPGNAPPYNNMGQSSSYDRRRDSAPAQYHHREDVAPQGQYHDRSHGAGHGRPNMRTPRHEARDAVLQTARQHLSEEEALRVEEALNLAHRHQPIADTQHSNASSSYESSHTSRRSPDIHHQRTSSAYTLETMDLLRRAAAPDHLSKEEMDQIELALNEDGNDNDNRQYSPAQHPHDFHHEPHHNLSGAPPPPIQQHYHPDHHYDRQHEHPHDRQYSHHEQEHPHDRQYPHEPQYQQHYHEQHEHPHDRPYLREPERQYSHEDDHPYPHEREREHQEHHSDHRHAPNRHSEQDGRASHQIRRDRIEEREAPRVVPQARGYRPNPRFAATTPRRTYSQDSVAMAKEEIQKGLAANTLSKEEYDNLMMALGASDGNADSGSYRNDNENTNTNAEDEGSLASREREDDYRPRDSHPTGDREDNYPSLPTIRSEDNHPPLRRNGSEDHDFHDDVDGRGTVPTNDTRQVSPRSSSHDSSSDRHIRLRNDQDGFVQRLSSPQSSAHESEDMAPVLVVDDAAITDMCPPFPESPQGENQQRPKESSLDHTRIPAEDNAQGADDVEAEQNSIRLSDEDAIHVNEDTQSQGESQSVEARPDHTEEAPHPEVIRDEEDSKSNEDSGFQAQNYLPNRSDLGTDYDDVGSGPSSSDKDTRASYDGTESASSSAVPSRRGSEGARPPSNRQMRLGSSHHSHSHHSQSRHSRRSNSQHLSAALAALPYARPTTQGAAGSVSIEMDYSVSQFGDSFATFGSDYLGNQRGDGSSVMSSETDLSRQNQTVAFSPKSVSSQTIRGVALLPPPLGGFEEDEGEEDVLQFVASADLSVSDHTDAIQPQAEGASISESTPEAATRDPSADSGLEEETANKRETFDVASENDVEEFDRYIDRDPNRDECDGHSQDLSDSGEVAQNVGVGGGSLPTDDDKNVAAGGNLAEKPGEDLLAKDDPENASQAIDLADSPSPDLNEASEVGKSDRPGRVAEDGLQDSYNRLSRHESNQDSSHCVAAQDSDTADQHPAERDRPHEQELFPGEYQPQQRQSTQNVERNRVNHEDGHDASSHEMQLGQDDKPAELSRVSCNGDGARQCDMQHAQDDQAREESRVGQKGGDGEHAQRDQALEERRVRRDEDAFRRYDVHHEQDDPRLEPRGGREGNAARHSDIQHEQEDQGPIEQRGARDGDHLRGYEMQHGQDDQELEEARIGRAGEDVRRYDMQHGQDDPGLEEQRAGRDAYDPETEHNFYPDHQHHWRRQHMRDNRVESERVNRHRWVEDHNGERSDRNYFRQRQHHSSRMLGRSESDPYERQRRHGGQVRQRRSDSELPEVPQQVQVDPGDLRATWAATGRSNSVSSLGESTQYSIYSAHFRNAEDYDRYRNEDYERALYEHNNWRQSHPTQLPHSIRESSNPYASSDHTGSSRRPQQHHLLPPSHSFGFHRENEYSRERPRDNEFDRERPRPVDPIADHDRFDEDLKRALYESMQMQRQSHPQREVDYDEDLNEHIDPHEHRLSREKMDHIARALSGPDPMEDARQSGLERFEASSNQFPGDRYSPSNRAVPMARDMSDPTHNRVVHQQNEESGHLEGNTSDLQAARIADDALDRALQEAKDEEERQSLLLARQLQQEDARRASRAGQSQVDSVHLLTNAGRVGAVGSTSPIRNRHPLEAEMTPPNESFRLSSLENEGARRHSSPTPGQRRPQDYSRRSLEGSYSSLHQSRSSAVGAVRSSSPERVRHPLEESFSSQQRSSRHVGAVRSSSPERALHPLEESYSSLGQGRSGQVGAIRSSNPERVRHPLEDSYSSLSQGRATQVGALQSTSPSRARHPLEDSYNSQTSPRRQDDSLRPTAQRLTSMDESLQQSSRSNRIEDSHGSLLSSVQENARRSLDDSYSSQVTPTPPGNAREAQAATSPTNDRTLDPSGSMLSVPSVSEQYGSFLSVPSVAEQRDIELPGLAAGASQDFPASAPPQASKEVAKDPTISPSPGKKSKNRRDSKVFGSVARLGKKGVTSLMQSIKLGSSRHIGSNHNAPGNLPSNGPAAPLSHQMDTETRMQVDRAMMKGILGQLNGVVKLGKEATIFHAEKGPESHGFDVAVKVYKRAQGSGSDHQDGKLSQFQNISSKDQLEFWTMKEFRNLKRARRAGVPSPLPLHTKNNILFMQFMGAAGRPAPQLGELDLRRGNKRWKTLYKQIVEALRRLFTSAELVHGDLNEGNVLVVPRHFIDATVSIDSKAYDADTAVLIDFGQTVDSKHPDAMDLLRGDVQNLRQFFVKQGIRTPSVDDALKFITSGNASSQEQSNNFDDSVNKP